MTTKVKPTVEGWDTSAKPDQTVVMITNSIFNAIGWEKHYTVKERQALNDVVDEIVSHSVQEAKAERGRIIKELSKIITPEGFENPDLCFDQLAEVSDKLDSLKQEEDK